MLLVILGLCFKLAAFPLHFYAGDVYTGAATPVTAMLSFVPKATGVIALLKVLLAGGAATVVGLPDEVWKVLGAIALLTMTVGNMMALLTENLKRVMAYSSIAHSGYMLVALTVLAAAGSVTYGSNDIAIAAAAGVLFYLLAYGVMNAGIFGVLMMLPTSERITDADGNLFRPPATSAETYREIRGVGRRHPLLTVAMAICCISLIGIPLTVGFLGKVYIFRPAVDLAAEANGNGAAWMWLLVIGVAVNAAIAAAYYLKILSEMILKPASEDDVELPKRAREPWPIVAATTISAGGAILLGVALPFISGLGDAATDAATIAATHSQTLPIDEFFAETDDVVEMPGGMVLPVAE
jgi:NADH-quinone oxidoreductase subunit N